MGFQLDLDIVRAQLEQKGVPYRVERILGTGGFGTVVKAHDTTARENVAIKFIHASRMHDYLCCEVRNHRILRHPHVIRFRRVLEVGGHLAIVMEYADGSSLFQVVKKSRRLGEPLARWIFQQLILAVDYCHRKGVASRDIKCENILLLKGHNLPIVKLSDFGYSHSATNQTSAKSIVGTADYMAPEVINNVDLASYDAFKADIWSCGVVLYVMLSGHYPFTRKHIPKGNVKERDVVRSKIVALDFKMPSQLSGGVCSLISKILTHANERISLQEIMEHPWFARHFPENARTMNSDLLKEEQLRGGAMRSIDWQTDEEVEHEIMKANWFDKLKRPREIVTDDFIDEELDAELGKTPKN